MKTCPKCGYENPDEAVYCLKCGAKIVVRLDLSLGGEAYSRLFNGLVLMLSIATALDMILNQGIRTMILGAPQLLLLPLLAVVVGLVIIFYAYFKGGEQLSLYRVGSILVGAGYLIFFIIPLIGGVSLVFPLWIIYLFLFLYLRRYGGSRVAGEG